MDDVLDKFQFIEGMKVILKNHVYYSFITYKLIPMIYGKYYLNQRQKLQKMNFETYFDLVVLIHFLRILSLLQVIQATSIIFITMILIVSHLFLLQYIKHILSLYNRIIERYSQKYSLPYKSNEMIIL